ncbi:LysM peptidoglycan-binding domain-containing protein [Hyphococcus sp.]|uniref:LysM peptidoglycan-binding domain-containing protein n=1 Tax=Hyphococcus sp. TaxID=2038636 RepID=UPI003CCC38A9
MKSNLLRNTAVAVLAATFTTPAFADQEDPSVTDTPAGTKILPRPSVQEDLVYLKDIVALQTLRLDEAEELIERQNALIEAQAQQLSELRNTVVALSQGQPAAMAQASDDYTVQSGDTLSSIARDNNTTIAALAEANNLRSPYPLRAGQTIVVPGAPAATARVAAAPTPAAPQPAQATQPAPQQQQTTQQDKTSNTPQTASRQAPAQQTQVAQNTTTQQRPQDERRDGALPTEVGVRPEDENERPYLAIFSDSGGILTPKGSLYLEPSIDYTVTADNRFFFQGIEIVDAVLIGAIEATDSNRQALTESLSMRYGLTNRLEVDGRISYVSRQDRIVGVAIDGGTASERDFGGYGIGDAEFGLHYQLNNGTKLPYTIANVRVKTPTGEGPFDVDRDLNTGIETELATGSGFWTVEPSLTFILASDPASLYANIGYQMNMSTSPNQVIVDTTGSPMIGTTLVRQTLEEFNPGDALRTSIGVGLSLNERLSLNFGYDQSYFFKSSNEFEILTRRPLFETMIDGMGDEVLVINPATDQPIPIVDENNQQVYAEPDITMLTRETNSATVGSFLFGGSYAVNDRLRINLNGAIGATDQAPDARVSVRASYRLFD